MTEYLELINGDIVLNAGCGIGGTTRFNFHITISDEQIEKSKELSKNIDRIDIKMVEIIRQIIRIILLRLFLHFHQNQFFLFLQLTWQSFI